MSYAQPVLPTNTTTGSNMRLLLLLVCSIVTACGGGDGGSDGTTTRDDVNGIWREPASDTIGIISGHGSRVDIIRGCCTHLSGRLEAWGGAILDSFLITYSHGSGIGYCSGEGTVTPKAAIHAAYSDCSHTSDFTLDMTYDPISDRQASLGLISGIWSRTTGDYTVTITIDESGSLFGSDTDSCTYTGSVTIPDSSVNTYKIHMNRFDCDDYFLSSDGRGILMDTVTANDTFLFIVTYRPILVSYSISDTLYRQ
jgi:hypothetical protein